MISRLLTLIAIAIFSTVHSATFVVNTTNDSGAGSLRDALQSASFVNGPHSILFNIPTSDPGYDAVKGIWLLSPATTYSMILKDFVTIDGGSQTSNQGNTNPYGPEIVLDGGNTINYALAVYNAENVLIKDLNIRNFLYGIQIFGTSAPYGQIKGCYIGTDEKGEQGMGNYIGIELLGGAHYSVVGGVNPEDRNIISGNQHIGVRLLDVMYCEVYGNYVGLNRMGTSAIPNYDGISLEGAVKYCQIGGSTSNKRNVVSGNVAYGLPLFGAGATGNTIHGNYFGTDITGQYAIPNTYGVLFDDGSYSNMLGGSLPGEGNLLSGNSGYGVFIYNMGTHSNVVQGNYIGTNSNGTTALPNAVGIVVDGAAYKHVIDGNIISGNLQQGIYINITGCDSTQIVRNRIGIAINNNPLPNGSDGIRISQGPKHSLIGGNPSEANIIAHNAGNGVYIMFANDDYHLISANSFYGNGGLAIDLFSPGVNPNDQNDPDSGPNDGLNFPEIDTVIFNSLTGEVEISGTLDTPNPELCEIQIYLADPDPSGHGEGKEYLLSLSPDNTGAWSAVITGLQETDLLTCLSIDPMKNTSEFSIARSNSEYASLNPLTQTTNKYLYPNPVSQSDKVISLVGFSGKSHTASICDLSGRLFHTAPIFNNQFHLPEGLSPAVYLLSISSDNSIEVIRLLVE